MANIITGGLSFALMSADSSAKAALKPMNMVSREMRKQDPDLELIERAGMYGGNELDHAGEALAKAKEELKESQKAARQEEKAEMETRLEEKTAEKKAEQESEEAAEQKLTEGDKAAENMVVKQVQTAGALDGTGRNVEKVGSETGLRMELSARQNYSAMIFQDKIMGMRMDLRG